MGTSTDYYKWIDLHPDYTVPMTLETDLEGDYWLMEADGQYYLFKFATDIDDTLDSGTSAVHGECFRHVE
jgi:glycosidase